MAWRAKSTWVNGEKPSATDLNNLALDIRAWGGNVDAGGYNLSNVAVLDVTNAFFTGPGTIIVRNQGITNEGGEVRLMDPTGSVFWGLDNYAQSLRFIHGVVIGMEISASGVPKFPSLPSSSSGLTAGQLWKDGSGFLRVA